jgi:nicotinamidase-related amidase
MFERDNLERNLPILLRGLEVLEISLIVTQQYTKGLGPTMPMIREMLGWNRDGSPNADRPDTERTAVDNSAVDPPPDDPSSTGRPYIEKIAFSCWGEPKFRKALTVLDREQVLLFGIETHICVLQTAVDLKAAGYTPVVIQDCTSSRRESDKHIALRRLQTEGILVSSFESILYELMREAGTDTFRAISRLVK